MLSVRIDRSALARRPAWSYYIMQQAFQAHHLDPLAMLQREGAPTKLTFRSGSILRPYTECRLLATARATLRHCTSPVGQLLLTWSSFASQAPMALIVAARESTYGHAWG